MAVARVVLFEQLEQRRVEVLPVRQLAAVELKEHPGIHLAGEEVVGGDDDVVAGASREQFAFQRFVGIEDVVDRLDASGLLELAQGVRGYVVRPVVDADGRFSVSDQGLRGQGEGREVAQQSHIDSRFLVVSAQWRRIRRSAAGTRAPRS
ncbi:hypothetical protein FQZ97_966810 [compost metagenome]